MNEHEQNVEVLLSQIESNSRTVAERMLVIEKRIGVVEANSAATADNLQRWHRRRTGVVSIMLGVFLGLTLTSFMWYVVIKVDTSIVSGNSPGTLRSR